MGTKIGIFLKAFIIITNLPVMFGFKMYFLIIYSENTITLLKGK